MPKNKMATKHSGLYQLPYTPHSAQALVHASRARFLVLCCGRGWGKDRCSIMHVFQKAVEMASEPARQANNTLVPKVLIWTVAPSFPMLNQLWTEIKTFFGNTPITIKTNEAEKRMEFSGGIVWELKSADKPDSLVGVRLDILHMTECARIKAEAWTDSLRPTLSGAFRGPNMCGQGIAIFNSTPLGSANWFHEIFIRGQKFKRNGEPNPLYDNEWESWQFPTITNPYVKLEEIERQRKTTPDDYFRQNYEAEFLLEGAGVFKYVDNALADFELFPVPFQLDHHYTIGYDPAFAQDFNVICVFDHTNNEVVYFDRFPGSSWATQKEQILMACSLYPNAPVLIDQTGVGRALVELTEDELAKLGDDRTVEGLLFTQNTKEDLITCLRMRFQNMTIRFPKEIETLYSELQAYEFVFTKTGRIKYGAPSGQFDDCVIGLALSVMAGEILTSDVKQGTYWGGEDLVSDLKEMFKG